MAIVTEEVVGIPAEEQWARTFNAVPDLILILDTQHRVVRANKAMADKLGVPPGALVGMTCHEVVHGLNAPPIFCPHSRVICDGGEHQAEVSDPRLGGTFLVSVSPIHGADGKVRGSVHVARDITTQKQAEEEARRAVQQRDQFLAMLSHELRNPLGAILNASYVLNRTGGRDTPSQEALAVIERQSRQMARLLDDLLDVSRVMQGKVEIRREKVDFVPIVQEAVRVVQGALDRLCHELTLDVAPGPLCLSADAAKLQQVVINLLNNAIKYTPPRGKIRLRLQRERDQLVLQVRDNGEGIAAEMLDRVFDLFFQADTSLHRSVGGMGVGLTLVRLLVEMQGGTVAVHSEGVGKGSEFEVRLPAHPSSCGGADAEAAVAQVSPATRILIVEDNADTRSMLRMLLELDGHQVAVAEDGLLGLKRLQDGEFDLALVDIGLPGIDGFEVARRYRSGNSSPRPRLVALTGYGRLSDREAVFAAGFDEHLVKPCDPSELARILKAIQ